MLAALYLNNLSLGIVAICIFHCFCNCFKFDEFLDYLFVDHDLYIQYLSSLSKNLHYFSRNNFYYYDVIVIILLMH